MWCGLEFGFHGGDCRVSDNGARVGVCAYCDTHQPALPPLHSGDKRNPDHHATLCHWTCHHSSVWPFRHCHDYRQRHVWPNTNTLGLWPARDRDRPDTRLHADRLSGVDRRCRKRQPLDGRSGADIACLPDAGAEYRVNAADPPRTCQCLSTWLHRKHGGFWQSSCSWW